MKEIKFRAWDKERKRLLVPLACVFHFSIDGFQGIEYHGGSRVEFFQNKHVELMQFTGLFDKNDKEIFEGDIVKEFKDGNNLEIKWDFHHVAFVAGNRWCEWLRGYGNSGGNRCMNCEVIGNIYETPELLKH